MILKAPKYLTKNFVNEFLFKFQNTFFWQKKLVPNVKIDLSTIIKVDIFGLLILYKYIDYTYNNFCFKKPNLTLGDYIDETWEKYSFRELIDSYVSNENLSDRPLKRLKVQFDDRFIIAPQALLRNSNYTNDYLKKEFIPKIEEYYINDNKTTDLIFSCFSEILLNFWEHAVNDTKSIIVADGNKHKIEIACADTGIGLFTNLRNVLEKKIKNEEILAYSVKRGITSKPNTNHMGFGLWLVNELVKINNGNLHIYSQGYYFHNNYGKQKYGKCSYWPGTLIYVNLSLEKSKTLSDLNLKFKDNLKIKFV